MIHVVTGLPRSGSTLLCNILNQRSDTFASSTSSLCEALVGLSKLLSENPTETSRLANIPGTAEHHVKIGRSLAESWHDTDAPVVFDKSRVWAESAVMLRSVIPDSGIVVLVRDPRDVLASIERRHRQTGLYGGNDLFASCSSHMSEDGLVGGPIKGVEDLMRRNLPNVAFVQYENLACDPARAMRAVEATCGLEAHEYNFDAVESTSTDLDVLYRGKFPHEGSGRVEQRKSNWSDVIPQDIATATVQRWPFFCRSFGYV